MAHLGEFQFFFKTPWTLRAIFCKGMKEEETGTVLDAWIWFIAREDEDYWLAHGLSSECDDEVAERVVQSIDGFDADVFITYAGEPWSIIAPLPVAHAQMMRDLVTAVQNVPSELERLRRLSKSELVNERKLIESEVQFGDRSDN